MSTVFRVKKKCAVCGKEHEFNVVGSTMTSGYMDLDTRPPQMMRSTLKYEIQLCDNCFYANPDISSVFDGFKKDALQYPPYLAVAQDARINKIGRAFLMSGYLYAHANQARKAGIQYLKAAWIFDDLEEEGYAKRARIKALQYLTVYVEESADMNMAVLCVDLQRRTGDFSGAIETAQQLIDYGAEELLVQILELQQKLSRNQDPSCHNVGEIE